MKLGFNGNLYWNHIFQSLKANILKCVTFPLYYDFFWFVIHMDVVITMQAYASEISNQKYQALGISMVRRSLQFCKHIFSFHSLNYILYVWCKPNYAS